MRKLLLLCLAFAFARPCQGGTETVISSVADCGPLGGSAWWSNPAAWTPMQVPNNGRPQGTTYDVVVPGHNCLTMYLDVSVTVNQLFLGMGYWNGAKQKATKVSANGVSLTVLKDARIDELNMTNGKLDVGGLLWISDSDGWVMADSKVKTGSYRQDSFTVTTYRNSIIETAGKFLVADYATAQLTQSTIETRELELLNGSLLLRDGATVKVKGDFKQQGTYAGLSFELNGRTNFTVEGNAQLGGSVSGSFSDGYVPSIGEEFPILQCKGAISGSWSTGWLPQLPAGRAWSVSVAGHTVYLKVVAAP